MSRGIVLDKRTIEALLYAAIEEGLLDNDPRIGDGYVRQLMSNPPSRELIKDAMEYLVLGGKVVVPFGLPKDLKGEIIERGVIESHRTTGSDQEIDIDCLSHKTVLSMLQRRGYRDWNEGKLVSLYNDYLEKYKCFKNLVGDKSFDGVDFILAMRQSPMGEELWPDFHQEYPENELKMWKDVQDSFRELSPVFSCRMEYSELISCSLRHDSLCSLPIDQNIEERSDFLKFSDAEERMSLLKITCECLHRIPIGRSLRETIEMSESPEANDLRSKLELWTHTLHKNNADTVESILHEVANARKSLRTAKSCEKVGYYTTIIGMPVALLGVLGGPITTIAGIAVSVIGGLSLYRQEEIEKMNQWAMYDSI